MKRIALLLFSCIVISSCERADTTGVHRASHADVSLSTGPEDYTRFIPLDSGNKMLTSYLSSIDAPDNDTDLYAVILVADSVRAYLQDPDIRYIKIMLSHSLDYINNGHQGQPAGYRNNALSFVIAGYDQAGDYVYHNGMVLERSMPCPTNCATGGTASNNLLIAE